MVFLRHPYAGETDMPAQNLSRRDFLRKVGAGSVALAAGAELFNPDKAKGTECEYRDMRDIFEQQDHKMTFSKYYIYTPPVSKGKEPGLEGVILLDGGIEAGSADEFRDFVRSNNFDAGTTVYLNSTGGVVKDALEIGRTIRERKFNTAIGTDPVKSQSLSIDRNSPPTEGVCLSACTFTFL